MRKNIVGIVAVVARRRSNAGPVAEQAMFEGDNLRLIKHEQVW
jgi:hypothetical protein